MSFDSRILFFRNRGIHGEGNLSCAGHCVRRFAIFHNRRRQQADRDIFEVQGRESSFVTALGLESQGLHISVVVFAFDLNGSLDRQSKFKLFTVFREFIIHIICLFENRLFISRTDCQIPLPLFSLLLPASCRQNAARQDIVRIFRR